jgi:putative MFS transporter
LTGAGTSSANVAARIERLPLCGFHRRFIVLIALGGWFDLYDLFMMAYVGAALQASHFLTLGQFTSVIAWGFGGMFLGTLGMGIASDRFGRRTVFVCMLLAYSFFTLLGAFAPSPGFLIATRFLAGIGVGAELVVIDTFVAEIVPKQARGKYLAIAHLIAFTGVPTAALLTNVLVPTHFLIDGWRWVLIIGSAGALGTWYARRRMPESPRWLESAGRHAEANQILEGIEDEVRRDCGSLPEAQAESAPQIQSAPFRDLFSPAYRGRTIMMVVFQLLQTVGVYGFANWAPTFLLRQGRNLGQSLALAAWMTVLSPAGPAIAVFTSERFERKWTIVVLALAMAVCGLMFPFASTAATIILTGAALTVLSYWFSAIYHMYQAELFPTRARATGVGFTYCWSRLSTVGSTILIGFLLRRGALAVFLCMSAAMTGVALVIGAFGPRVNSRPLDDVSS